MNSTAKMYAVISGVLAFILVLALALTVLTQPAPKVTRTSSLQRVVSQQVRAPVKPRTTILNTVRVPSTSVIAQSVTVKK